MTKWFFQNLSWWIFIQHTISTTLNSEENVFEFFLREFSSAAPISNIIWYANASHQTHDICKGHTGSILTFGKGTTTSSSTKQRIPSKSSTESKLIGLHDKVNDILWTRQFLEAQGYNITSNTVYQDNMSTLCLAKNDYVSSSKRTKHIKVKYLIVWHFHHTGKLTLLYRPTEQMWANVLTKPLQGVKFCLMHSFLMNCLVDYCDEPPFILSSNPTLALVRLSTKALVSPSLPSPNNSFPPMKPRVPLTMPSSRVCVGVTPITEHTDAPTSHKSCEPVPKYSGPPDKKVSWRDTLFQNCWSLHP